MDDDLLIRDLVDILIVGNLLQERLRYLLLILSDRGETVRFTWQNHRS
jgi:hypothetical protein